MTTDTTTAQPTVQLSAYGLGSTRKPIASLREAAEAVYAFTDEYYLGGRDWTGGHLRVGSKLVGYISYNGRAWHGNPRKWKPDTKEMTEAEFAEIVAKAAAKAATKARAA